jgi:hypothetical protein
MPLQRLVVELDGVKQQTADLVDDVGAALAILTDPKMSDENACREASTLIGSALKGQENLEFLCQNMALAVRQFALLPRNTPPAVYDEVWANLVSDWGHSFSHS